MDEKNTIKKTKKNKIIEYIFLFFILGTLIYIAFGVYKENKIELKENEKIEKTKEATIKNIEKIQIYTEKINIPEKYLNYTVDAKLNIPKINLKTYILKDYTKEGLEICASKFWGPEPNEIGNYCIAGHNYNKEKMFNHLIDLEIGDEIFLSDNKNGEVSYEIKEIYKVKPENIEPINQETKGKRIITLITCVNYSKNRLIVQGFEKTEEKERIIYEK